MLLNALLSSFYIFKKKFLKNGETIISQPNTYFEKHI